MTARTLLRRLPGDERAQAMTEFVIVLPMILLMFFGSIQTLLIAQANQLGNYAAFSAARSYATSYSKFFGQTGNANSAHSKAQTRAKNAALLIMAPVSHAQLGEGLPLWRPLRNPLKRIGGRAWRFYGLAEGYAVAAIFRMQDFRVQRPANSSQGVVKVSFGYAMPLSVPGLAEIWDYLAGLNRGPNMDQTFTSMPRPANPGFNASVNEVVDSLADMEARFGLPIFGKMSDSVADVMKSVNSSGYQGARYAIRLGARSMCGFEPWSGRVRRDADAESYCDANPDPSRQDCIDAAQANDEAAQIEADECDEANLADEAFEDRVRELNAAKAVYNSCIARVDDPADCAAEEAARDAAQVARDAAHAHATTQSKECKDAGKVLQDAVDKMEQECQ